MNIKKAILVIILILIIVALIIFGVNISNKNHIDNSEKIKVVSSNFASYDFLRAIIGDNKNIELTFLLGPGKDAHSYDPTAQDLIKIQNADLFVYIGGEMESWSDKVLESLDNKSQKIICISNDIDKIEEKKIDGAEEEQEETEEEGAFDEHIWTSPANAIKMINVLEQSMEEIDGQNKEKYKENTQKYIQQIQQVDKQIKQIVDDKVRDTLLFGDRMPMQYFMDYYNLNVSAAFSGCSTQTEPSSKTIAYLVNKAKKENIPVILYIELNTGKVANTIASEVGNNCQAIQIQTIHNVTKTDFDNGETWVSLMKRNIDVLKKALQ